MNNETQTPQTTESPTQTGHTPGPWKIDHDDGTAAAAAEPEIIIEADDRHIAFCFGAGSTNDQQAVADYHLIVSAPDLLEALKYARRFLDPEKSDVAYIDATIAKATKCS